MNKKGFGYKNDCHVQTNTRQ